MHGPTDSPLPSLFISLRFLSLYLSHIQHPHSSLPFSHHPFALLLSTTRLVLTTSALTFSLIHIHIYTWKIYNIYLLYRETWAAGIRERVHARMVMVDAGGEREKRERTFGMKLYEEVERHRHTYSAYAVATEAAATRRLPTTIYNLYADIDFPPCIS